MNSSTHWCRLLLKASVGATLFAFANVAVYHGSEYFRISQDYDAAVKEAIRRKNVHVVLVGDSHVAVLEKDVLLSENAYNIARGGDGPREIYAKLRFLFSRADQIRTVILSTDLHMFGAPRQISSNRAFVDWYLVSTGSPYGLEHRRLSAMINAIPLFNDDFVQYLKKSFSIRMKHYSDSPTKSSKKTEWASLNESDRASIARRTGESDHQGIGSQPEAQLWYERIATLIRQHGARLIAVRLPAHPDFFASIPPTAIKKIDAELEKVKIAPPLDYRYSFGDPTYFVDEDHLNGKGAVALLKLMEHDTGERLLNESISQYSENAR